MVLVFDGCPVSFHEVDLDTFLFAVSSLDDFVLKERLVGFVDGPGTIFSLVRHIYCFEDDGATLVANGLAVNVHEYRILGSTEFTRFDGLVNVIVKTGICISALAFSSHHHRHYRTRCWFLSCLV